MKFGKYLEDERNQDWKDEYLDYKKMKDLIKECVVEADAAGAAHISRSPRTASLSVQRVGGTKVGAQEQFFSVMETEVRDGYYCLSPFLVG